MSSNKAICVIAASNSYTLDGKLIDYIQLASIAAERVKFFLNLDTYLITEDIESAKEYKSFFADILINSPKKISKRTMLSNDELIQYNWKNDSRIEVFNLTKHLADKILMIDADYMIASDQLKVWLNTDYPFILFDTAIDAAGSGVYNNKYFPSNDITQCWATAMCWTTSYEAEIIFDTAKMVRDNYEFYATMLCMPKGVYRNDLAFSVACHLHNIPLNKNQKLWNLIPTARLEYFDKIKQWLIYSNNKVVRWNHDIHILNKQYAIDKTLMDNLRLRHDSA